ncbi:MAG TPA: class I SAM-dependent methyltransferase, partial [Chloroflexota bacterium]|nr:class I SAM-dependent methyltransferase [Chloroflexota bacterium]
MINETDQPPRSSSFWDRFWDNSNLDNARRATLTISARLAAELLDGEPVSRVLDLGCGFGEVAIMVSRRLHASIVAADISEHAVSATSSATRTAGLMDRICTVRADCYRLGFADCAFDAVMSYGYASAASYEGAEKEVARVLRPGGVAVIDFRNISFYNTVLDPMAGWRIWRRYRRHEKVYHLGPLGLREHFAPAGLDLEQIV